MIDQENSFYSQNDEQAIEPNNAQPEKTWDVPPMEPERSAQQQQDTIDERLADVADTNESTDSPPLRSEMDPPRAPDIIPDQSPDEINYPGKQDIPRVEQPKFFGSSISSSSSIGNEDDRPEKGDEAQELQLKEEEERKEKIKDRESDLREAVEGREESIRKSEDGNISDNRGYNEIRENSPVGNDRDKEFLN
ncbi:MULTISPECIES: hypothetical protein [Emticicia]|uniref:hypothetical protein n=1 Tax=Emticicia TaxID=312278 RepID=UPI00209CA414|nr:MULTISPECIES: hypothetical protein [Emticicia]UTA67696.1 hypothetical protein MB380_19170 [Emticicia sp. 21SJ11W-3]